MKNVELDILLECLGKWGRIWHRRYFGRKYFDWEDLKHEGWLFLRTHIPHPRHLDVACKFAILDVIRSWCGRKDSDQYNAERRMISSHTHVWLLASREHGYEQVDLDDFLEWFIPTLLPKDQEVLACIRKEDTIPEIAIKMGVSECMIRVRLRRIGELLKKELRKD
jgi:hypothetical protein